MGAGAGVATRARDRETLDARPGWRWWRRRCLSAGSPGALPQRAHGVLEAEELDEKADDVRRDGVVARPDAARTSYASPTDAPAGSCEHRASTAAAALAEGSATAASPSPRGSHPRPPGAPRTRRSE